MKTIAILRTLQLDENSFWISEKKFNVLPKFILLVLLAFKKKKEKTTGKAKYIPLDLKGIFFYLDTRTIDAHFARIF